MNTATAIPRPAATAPPFLTVLERHGLCLHRGDALRVLQINVGKRCNQTCVHCHVGAGPNRTEVMSAQTADRILEWISRHRPGSVDLTGGAPEACPEFRRLVTGASAAGARVTVRCNLTILLEPGNGDLPEFYGQHGVEVLASLPCYLEDNVDAQRGSGVYQKSLTALRRLNEVGYGLEDDLQLVLVYNPVGATIAPVEGELEPDYRKYLREQFGIEFHRLACITNLPITRFRKFLDANGGLEAYQRLLLESFNPDTVGGLMCRDTLNVGWEGDLFDCDFNQMVGLDLGGEKARFLWDIEPENLAGSRIATGPHCFGCTAGHGASCGGTLA